MTFRDLHGYCLSEPGAPETLPFGDEARVSKVAGRMFALTGIERLPLSVSLTCDPDRAAGS